MGKHLNEDLGHRYVQEWFTGALFEHNGEVCKLRACTEDTVTVDALPLDDENSDWVRRILNAEVLKDFETFKYPTLGFREKVLGGNKWVGYLSTRRSAHRGLRHDMIACAGLPIYNNLKYPFNNDVYFDMEFRQQIRMWFRPKFTKYSEGMKLLMNGDIPAFALNEQMAIALSVNVSADRSYDIYFRNKAVGTIDDNGNITLHNKVVERDVIKKALRE